MTDAATPITDVALDELTGFTPGQYRYVDFDQSIRAASEDGNEFYVGMIRGWSEYTILRGMKGEDAIALQNRNGELFAAAPSMRARILADRATIAELKARVAELEGFLTGEFQYETAGSAATSHLREMYPSAFQALGSSARRSLRNFIDQHVKASLIAASRELDAGEMEEE